MAPAPPGRGGAWRWKLKEKRAGGGGRGAKGRRPGAVGAGWCWSREAAAAARAGPPGRGRRKPLGHSLRYLPEWVKREGPWSTPSSASAPQGHPLPWQGHLHLPAAPRASCPAAQPRDHPWCCSPRDPRGSALSPMALLSSGPLIAVISPGQTPGLLTPPPYPPRAPNPHQRGPSTALHPHGSPHGSVPLRGHPVALLPPGGTLTFPLPPQGSPGTPPWLHFPAQGETTAQISPSGAPPRGLPHGSAPHQRIPIATTPSQGPAPALLPSCSRCPHVLLHCSRSRCGGLSGSGAGPPAHTGWGPSGGLRRSRKPPGTGQWGLVGRLQPLWPRASSLQTPQVLVPLPVPQTPCVPHTLLPPHSGGMQLRQQRIPLTSACSSLTDSHWLQRGLSATTKSRLVLANLCAWKSLGVQKQWDPSYPVRQCPPATSASPAGVWLWGG